MKNHLLLVILTILSVSGLYAQEFKPFKVDVGINLTAALGNTSGRGIGGYLEPRFSSNDHLTFGLRLESAGFSSGNITINTQEIDISSTSVKKMTFVTEYFFNTAQVRPFIGLGLGVFQRQSYGVNVGLTSVSVGELNSSLTNFGFAPRVGVNAGHLRISGMMNFSGNDIANFFSLNVGFEFGGGRQ
ncbi:MAG: hypothetical protein AAFX57_04400 [Bacteroidota bacterium]